jgi:PAS domain S-box-containing protein
MSDADAVDTLQQEVARLRGRLEQAERDLKRARQPDETEISLFEISGAAMAEADPRSRRLTRVNAALCALTGYSETELLAMTVDELTDPRDRQENHMLYSHLARGKNSYSFEKRYVCKDGTAICVLVTASLLRDPHGQPLRAFAVIQDITAHKQAEKALQESEERLRLAIETTGLAVHDYDYYDLGADRLLWSRELYALTGVPCGQTISWPMVESIIHPEDRPRFARGVHDVFFSPDSRGEFAEQYRIRRFDTGEERWIYHRARVLFHESEGGRKPMRSTGVVIDITERKRAEAFESSERSRKFLSAIVKAATDTLFCVLDRDGRIIHFNQVCEKLTGYSEAEVKGRRPWDFLLLAAEVSASRKFFTDALEGKSSRTEGHLVCKDGIARLVAWSVSPALIEGSPAAYIASGVDITDQIETRRKAKEGEAIIRGMMETAAQAILVANRAGRIVLVNATAERMFGYSREELIGQSLERLMPERLRALYPSLLAKWFNQLDHKQVRQWRELFGRRKDGTEFPAEAYQSCVSTATEVLGVSFFSDVTERKRHEKTALDYQKRLQLLTASLMGMQESANRELARELHDSFCQELAALSIEVGALRTRRSSLGKLLAGIGGKISELADQMHSASRRLHPQIVHELGIKAALEEEGRRFSEQTAIALHVQCDDFRVPISEDVALNLYRVVQEALLNVRKHAGKTQAWLELRQDCETIVLRIVDDGSGFDLDEVRRKGGLGLVSMEERARLINGNFDIRSRPGQGTTVEVLVPLDPKTVLNSFFGNGSVTGSSLRG